MAPKAGLQIDWSDPDTLTGVLGGILGLSIGIGAPLFYISRDRADEKKLEELRELNRQTYKETGQYLTEVKLLLHTNQVVSEYTLKLLPYKSCRKCAKSNAYRAQHPVPCLTMPKPCRKRLEHSGNRAGRTEGVLLVPDLAYICAIWPLTVEDLDMAPLKQTMLEIFCCMC